MQNWSKHLESLLEGRTGIVADILNRLVLKRSVGERAELRTSCVPWAACCKSDTLR